MDDIDTGFSRYLVYCTLVSMSPAACLAQKSTFPQLNAEHGSSSQYTLSGLQTGFELVLQKFRGTESGGF
jgi:hypothetical protein